MKSKKNDRSSDFSRRDFVKVAGLGAAAISVPGSAILTSVEGVPAPQLKQEELAKDLKTGEGAPTPQIPYTQDELFEQGPQRSYTGRHLEEIAFPIGGIGTGSITLGGWGQLRDWEIMNRPAKGFVSPRSFFTLKARFPGRPAVTKVLQGPVQGSYVGAWHSVTRSFVKDDLGHGLPHFRHCTFTGHFLIATLFLEDHDIPLRVTLEAFNPFIPSNDKDSSIPVAIFSYTFENMSDQEVSATVYGNLTNIIGGAEEKDRVNLVREGNGITGLYLTTKTSDVKSPHHGSMVLDTACSPATVWPRWKQNLLLAEFWNATALSDDFPPEEEGQADTGTLATDFSVKPNGKATVSFFLSPHLSATGPSRLKIS